MAENRFDPIIDDSFTSAPLRSTMSESMKENPDNRAKLLSLSDKTGIPADAIAPDVQGVETKARFDDIDFSGMTERSPGTSKFLENYDSAAVAHDDLDNLQETENLFSGLGGVISRRYQDILAGSELLIRADDRRHFPLPFEGSTTELGKSLYAKGLAATQRRTAELLEGIHQRGAEVSALTPKNLNFVEEGIRAGIESLAIMAPAIATGIATRSPRAGTLAVMGVSTLSSSYATARDKGLPQDEALLYSQIQAAIEVGTEVLPVSSLVDIFQNTAKSAIGKKVAQFMVREMATEQLATLGQTFTDYMFDLDEELAAAETFAEAATIQARRQAVTAVATIVGGGIQSGVAVAGGKATDRLLSRKNAEEVKSQAEQSTIDDLVELAEKSKVKDRRTESYKQFMQQVAPDAEIYIDGPAALEYLQNLEGDASSDPVLARILEQATEAAQNNGEVTMSVADFAADLVGSEHFEALRPHMTMSSDTISPARHEREKALRESTIRKAMDLETEGRANYTENRAIYKDIVQQMVASGKVSPRVAKFQAEIVPAWATVMAEHTGIPVSELYAKVGLKVEGPHEDRKQAVAEGNAELGRVFEQQDFGEVTFDEEFTRAATGEPIVVKKSAQRVFEQTQKKRMMGQKLLDCLSHG